MTIPNALVLARLKEDAGSEARFWALFGGCPHVILEDKGSIETDLLKEYALKIRLRVFEAADRSFFRKRHSAARSLRIMRDAIVDISLLNQADFVLAPLGERLPPDRFPAEGYNEAVYAFLSDLIDFLTGCGGLVMCCLKMSGEYHLFLAGNSANLADGTLYDVIPTFLDLAGLSKPDDMKGTSLII